MKQFIRRWSWIAPCLALVALLAGARVATRTSDMTRMAQAFLNELKDGQKAKALFKFDDAYRKDWGYVPKERRGLPLAEMNDDQRGRVKKLLASALSDEGVKKVDGVMQLEGILRELESKPGAPATGRDPERYFVTIFGEPSNDKPWAWRFEGHHLSLSFSSATNELVSIAPFFFGSNPGEVKTGPHGGMRLLGKEEDMAREFAESLNDAEKELACPKIAVPADIILGAGRAASFQEPPGIEFKKLRPELQLRLLAIVDCYARNFESSLADGALARIRDAGIENLHFAWIGSTEVGQPHYWRIQSKTFSIELDNTQDNANHVHTAWRDFTNDFGEDFLREHYAQEHKR